LGKELEDEAHSFGGFGWIERRSNWNRSVVFDTLQYAKFVSPGTGPDSLVELSVSVTSMGLMGVSGAVVDT
jgi:hypothetical protein